MLKVNASVPLVNELQPEETLMIASDWIILVGFGQDGVLPSLSEEQEVAVERLASLIGVFYAEWLFRLADQTWPDLVHRLYRGGHRVSVPDFDGWLRSYIRQLSVEQLAGEDRRRLAHDLHITREALNALSDLPRGRFLCRLCHLLGLAADHQPLTNMHRLRLERELANDALTILVSRELFAEVREEFYLLENLSHTTLGQRITDTVLMAEIGAHQPDADWTPFLVQRTISELVEQKGEPHRAEITKAVITVAALDRILACQGDVAERLRSVIWPDLSPNYRLANFGQPFPPSYD